MIMTNLSSLPLMFLSVVFLWVSLPFSVLAQSSHAHSNTMGSTKYQVHATMEMLISSIPKIELHAHLHGSIRPNTLSQLAQMQGIDLSGHLDGQRDLNKCFALFQAIHRVIDRKEILKHVLFEILHDFMEDNVIYLELRTTPRILPHDKTTKQQYLQLVTSWISMHNQRYGDRMLVRLIISIDRSKSTEENNQLETLVNNHDHRDGVIVGIDFSGNPTINAFSDYVPLLERFKSSGTVPRFTVHAAEVVDHQRNNHHSHHDHNNATSPANNDNGGNEASDYHESIINTDHVEATIPEMTCESTSESRESNSVSCKATTEPHLPPPLPQSSPLTPPPPPPLLLEDEEEDASSGTPNEFDSILSFNPHRLGHALQLLPRQVQVLLDIHDRYKQQQQQQQQQPMITPTTSTTQRRNRRNHWQPPPLIEICPTSNKFTLNHTHYDQHPHLSTWISQQYPIAISTDDSGVFATNLTYEYIAVIKAFHLTLQQAVYLAAQPLDYIFATDRKKEVALLFANKLFASMSREALVLPLNVVTILNT